MVITVEQIIETDQFQGSIQNSPSTAAAGLVVKGITSEDVLHRMVLSLALKLADLEKKSKETGILDIDGNMICLGDKVMYDFDDEDSVFTVIFEEACFRKYYEEWDETMLRPILETQDSAINMRLKIVK